MCFVFVCAGGSNKKSAEGVNLIFQVYNSGAKAARELAVPRYLIVIFYSIADYESLCKI